MAIGQLGVIGCFGIFCSEQAVFSLAGIHCMLLDKGIPGQPHKSSNEDVPT